MLERTPALADAAIQDARVAASLGLGQVLTSEHQSWEGDGKLAQDPLQLSRGARAGALPGSIFDLSGPRRGRTFVVVFVLCSWLFSGLSVWFLNQSELSCRPTHIFTCAHVTWGSY